MTDLAHMPARFVEKTRREGECIIWTAYVNETGYGKFRADGKSVRAHRYAYELEVGPIPVGLVLDHLCRNTRCVNPAHLEPVTLRENFRRGIRPHSNKTHCPRGHEYTEENTYRGRAGGNKRECRTCNRLFGRAPRQRVQRRPGVGVLPREAFDHLKRVAS